MLIKWGSVSSQYWTEGQKDLFDRDENWQERRIEHELNYAQALWTAFQNDYLTAGPNWVNDICGDYDVTIYIHPDCGYGDCEGVCFYHEAEDGDPYEADREGLFLRCVAKATQTTPEYVKSALRENGFDFRRNY